MSRNKYIPITLCGLLLTLLFAYSCNDTIDKKQTTFIEAQPTFFNLRNGDWLKDKWIRKPENLLTIHETFKKFGYMNLIGSLFDNKPLIFQDIYINKKADHLIDSLVLTYTQKDINVKYYREFWQRRINEHNDSVVYLIIKDIQYSYHSKLSSYSLQMKADTAKVNDTLFTLLSIEYRYDSLAAPLAMQDFETLKRFGFHQSAYNLLYEYTKYSEIAWNKDSLVKTLTPSNKYIYPWIPDDSK